MAEYIVREAVLQKIKKLQETDPKTVGKKQFADGYFLGLTEAEIIITAAIAAPVAPVKIGRNETKIHPVDEFICSECGFACEDIQQTIYDEDGEYSYYTEYEFRYCPNCGAKMED